MTSAFVLVLGTLHAYAQSAPAGSGAPVRPTANDPGVYAGLTPPRGGRIPGLTASERRRAGARAIVAWPGFQVTAQGTRVFVATSREVTVTVRRAPGRFVYVFANAYVPIANNRRPLIMAGFETPIDRAFLQQRGVNVELVLQMRVEVEPNLSHATDPDGLHYTYLDFVRWHPPDHVPRMVPRGHVGGQGALRLSTDPPDEPGGAVGSGRFGGSGPDEERAPLER